MDHLTDLLLDLCALPCVTGEEGPIADWLADRYAARGDVVIRVGNSIVAAAPEEAAAAEPEADERPTVLLVGHTDVVPPTEDDLHARVEDHPELGRVVVGRGASDMKSGLAVAMDAFEDPATRQGPYRPVLVAYAGEEGPHEGNELGEVLRAVPGLADAALAIVLEPTDLRLQLGCMGALHAEVTFPGRAAHSARPWQGDNALARAGAWLTGWRDREPVDVDVDGLVYREVTSPTQAWTANARNVVPAAFTVNVNHRFAPDKTLEEAEAQLRRIVAEIGPAEEVEVIVTDRAPAAPPSRGTPAVEAFITAADAPVAPQQSWTDVARFAEIGVPALNYGPGLTAQSHQRGELAPVANLTTARQALDRFLTG